MEVFDLKDCSQGGWTFEEGIIQQQVATID
jgi:hypothetical protein